MPNFDPQYTYAAAAISASGHTGNLTSNPPERGLYTLYNGSLDSNNLNIASFGSSELQLSEYAAFDKYDWSGPRTIYDNTIGGSDTNAGSPCGLGLRFMLPSQADVVRLDVCTFVSAARAVKVKRQGVAQAFVTTQKALELKIVPFLDGAAIAGTTYKLPQSLFAGHTTTTFTHVGGLQRGLDNHISSFEHRYSQQYRNSYVVQNLAKGIHTFELRVIMESPGALFTLEGDTRVGLALGALFKNDAFGAVVHQRLTFGSGCITMRALGLNSPST